jgi:TIR domain
VAFDAFISYASQDKPVADAVCARLEAAGIRCWIAPRDITPGMSYGEAIINAIHAARVMILVFSSHANASPQVPKEIERAVSNNVPIIPYRIENVTPGASLDYFIGSVHWLDALTPPMEQHLDSLVATVRKLVPHRDGEDPRPIPGPVPQPIPPRPSPSPVPPQPTPPPQVPRSNTALIIGAIAVAAVLAFGIYRFTSRPADNPGAQDNGNNTQPAPVVDPTPSNDVTPTPAKKSAPAPAREPATGANGNPIAGCWLVNGASPYTVHADGSISAGPFTGHWRDLGGGHYTFTWPDMIETLTISPDQRNMSGGNQFGFPISGGRTSGTVGPVGNWHWANGWNVSISPGGTFTSGSWSGTWRIADSARGIFEMTWPKPVDQVLLLGGGMRIQAANQYGVASYSVRASNCSE